MEYRGAEIKVVQGINGGKWKWTVEMAAGRKQGEARRRDVAVAAAKKAVDLSFNPKKVRLAPRAPGAHKIGLR